MRNSAWFLIKIPALECCEEIEGTEVSHFVIVRILRIVHTFCDALRFQVCLMQEVFHNIVL